MSPDEVDERALDRARSAGLKEMDDLALLLALVGDVAQGAAEAILLDDGVVLLDWPAGAVDPYYERRDQEVEASVADVRDTVIPDKYGPAWEILERMRR